MMQPDVVFETSWEVCNRVGGIYAVLSTKAASMVAQFPNQVYFFGPDLGKTSDVFFKEDKSVLKGWKHKGVRVGRWNIPGQPVAILVDYSHLWPTKNEIYGHVWSLFSVKSHAACGDYDDSCLFGYAVGEAAESLYHFLKLEDKQVVMHTNEWQTAFTIFYLKEHCPAIRTLFTTHATGIGRSIAGNGKPLYDYFTGYNGDQMAEELGMVSKHSAERQAAHYADCFSTVSDITARECSQLLDKPVDVVTPNGFEQNFVPKGSEFTHKRNEARRALLKYASKVIGRDFPADTPLICTAGRLEWKNKGIDVFVDSVKRVKTPAIAFVMIPYLDMPHVLDTTVKIIFVPHYLNGQDGIFNMSYYDLLIGMDLTIFPSYYEPWGYTPLESIAFHVPTITTSLSGFGIWSGDCKAVRVIPRGDANTESVIEDIVTAVEKYFSQDKQTIAATRRSAAALAKKASWEHFFIYYQQAYDIALKK